MLKSGKKFRALRDINKNILTRVLSEIFFLNETNNHKVKWSVPNSVSHEIYIILFLISNMKIRYVFFLFYCNCPGNCHVTLLFPSYFTSILNLS